MRLRACMGFLLLAVGGCAQLPGMVRLDVDGRTVEIRQRGFSSLLASGGWSARACGTDGLEEPDALPGTITAIEVIAPDMIEVMAPEGRAIRLYKCAP